MRVSSKRRPGARLRAWDWTWSWPRRGRESCWGFGRVGTAGRIPRCKRSWTSSPAADSFRGAPTRCGVAASPHQASIPAKVLRGSTIRVVGLRGPSVRPKSRSIGLVSCPMRCRGAVARQDGLGPTSRARATRAVLGRGSLARVPGSDPRVPRATPGCGPAPGADPQRSPTSGPGRRSRAGPAHSPA